MVKGAFAGDINEYQPVEGAQHFHRAHLHEERDDVHPYRNGRGHQEVEHEQVGAGRFLARQGVGSQATQDQLGRDCRYNVDYAVAHGGGEIAFIPSLGEVFDDDSVRRTQWILPDFELCFERVKKQDSQGYDSEGGQQQQNGMVEDQQLAALFAAPSLQDCIA